MDYDQEKDKHGRYPWKICNGLDGCKGPIADCWNRCLKCVIQPIKVLHHLFTSALLELAAQFSPRAQAPCAAVVRGCMRELVWYYAICFVAA